MFRRRPFRPLRGRRPGPPLMPPGQRVPEPLRRAVRLLDEGRFEEAAAAFEGLAQGAEEKGALFRAANLAAQAARCYLNLDDVDKAYDRGRKALELFERAERPAAARRLGDRMVRVLRERGREEQAQALEGELGRAPYPDRTGMRRGELPGKCPQCGGPIKEAETNWVGPSSAECPYCGSVLKAG